MKSTGDDLSFRRSLLKRRFQSSQRMWTLIYSNSLGRTLVQKVSFPFTNVCFSVNRGPVPSAGPFPPLLVRPSAPCPFCVPSRKRGPVSPGVTDPRPGSLFLPTQVRSLFPL